MGVAGFLFSFWPTVVDTFSGIVEWVQQPITIAGQEFTPIWLVAGGGLTLVLGYLVVKWVLDIVL